VGSQTPQNADLAAQSGVDTGSMTPLALDLREQPMMREVRCECAVCGAHTTGWQAFSLGASCNNCGSYDMRPVQVIAPRG